MRLLSICLGLLFLTFSAVSCAAQTAEETSPDVQETPSETTQMTGEALKEIISSFDAEAELSNNGAIFTLVERQMMLVFDENAGRMRLVTPILPAAVLDQDTLTRVLQANYDAVLDARYAIANDLLWSVFIHPLTSLTEEDFISAIAQTITAAETFGTSYTSGAVVFGGGDSNALHEDLLEKLEELRKAERERERI